ncbi:MAG: FtsX-like permease family protein [Bifidobacteriaceae bacterium]|jgi:putative ABC transport system permease protein|nr:FtsX-like permease family protein [Bifidobacteriaceae bacterium]
MKRKDIMHRSLQSLKHAKIRTAFTSLAISVGAFTISAALSAGYGTKQYIEDLLAENVDISEKKALLDAVAFAEAGVIFFGCLALLASVFGIINTQYISVLERKRQIGMMRSLGVHAKDVSKLFRYEAGLIGLFGGLIGCALAFILTLFNDPLIRMLQTNPNEQPPKLLIFDWVSSSALLIFLIIIAVIAGYFPARKAAKLRPVEALRG